MVQALISNLEERSEGDIVEIMKSQPRIENVANSLRFLRPLKAFCFIVIF